MMKVKVCGMRDAANLAALIELNPEFIGMIFYDKSKRFVKDPLAVKIPSSIKKIGVFVNENKERIIEIADRYKLDGIQLHGDESPGYCRSLKSDYLTQHNESLLMIRAFSVDEAFDFSSTSEYEDSCDLFIFDTKAKNQGYGGTGMKFNWTLLSNYFGETPFLLSGGISADDSEAVNKFSHPCFIGIDINSRFEHAPAVKNIEMIKEFKAQLI